MKAAVMVKIFKLNLTLCFFYSFFLSAKLTYEKKSEKGQRINLILTCVAQKIGALSNSIKFFVSLSTCKNADGIKIVHF